MAVLQVYTVFDKALGAFARPFFVPTRGMALRGFIDECANPSSEVRKHASDYALFYIGGYDEATGMLQPLVAGPELVANAVEFVEHS